MKLIKIDKNDIVVKHKDLIWEARYRLSELGIKAIAVLISMINVNDKDFKEYNLKINDFKELTHSNTKKVYEYVNVMTDELMKKPFSIRDEKFNWVYYAKYHEGDNYVTLKIAPELKPYLLALKGSFIKYDITNILPLKSGYIIRLYELFKSKFAEYKHYNLNATSYTIELKIDWLRQYFEIPTSYQYSSHIKERIINKAQKQFMQKTDIKFTYKEQKIGRKVDRLVVTIRENIKGSNDYLNTRKSFIDYVREKYKPDPDAKNFPLIAKTDQGDLKIDLTGKLYFVSGKKGIQDLDSKKADKIWSFLYEGVKNKKFEL